MSQSLIHCSCYMTLRVLRGGGNEVEWTMKTEIGLKDRIPGNWLVKLIKKKALFCPTPWMQSSVLSYSMEQDRMKLCILNQLPGIMSFSLISAFTVYSTSSPPPFPPLKHEVSCNMSSESDFDSWLDDWCFTLWLWLTGHSVSVINQSLMTSSQEFNFSIKDCTALTPWSLSLVTGV